jgi:hypothetical protein
MTTPHGYTPLSQRLAVHGPASVTNGCPVCGCVYRQREDNVPDGADFQKLLGKIQPRPCPGCGTRLGTDTPPPTVWFAVAHLLLGFVSLVVVLTALLVPGMTQDGSDVAPPLGRYGLVAIALLHGVVTWQWGRMSAASLSAAHADVAAGRTQIITEGSPHAPPNRRRAWATIVGLALTGVAAALVLPETRTAPDVGIARNPHLAPEIVVPGKRFHFGFTDPGITTIYGDWAGTGRVQVLNAAELGLPEELPGGTAERSWGDRIVSGRLSHYPAKLGVDVTLPDDERLHGKTVKMRALVSGYGPVDAGPTFKHKDFTAQRDFEVVVAEREPYEEISGIADRRGRLIWVVCGLSLVGAVFLMLSIRPAPDAEARQWNR